MLDSDRLHWSVSTLVATAAMTNYIAFCNAVTTATAVTPAAASSVMLFLLPLLL